MSRVLRRPMFRRGGQADGITTGLGRQGYSNAGTVQKYQDFRNMFLVLLVQLSFKTASETE